MGWAIEYWDGAAWTAKPDAILVKLSEELNGHEEITFRLPNSSANRTFVETNKRVRVKFNGAVLWTGMLYAPVYGEDMIDCVCYNECYERMKAKDFTGEYSATAANTILSAICSAAGVTAGECPTTTVSVRFKRALCFDAAVFLSDVTNKDFWSDYDAAGTPRFNIGDKRGGTVLELPKDEGSGNIAYDQSGKGNDGNLMPVPLELSTCESVADWSGVSISLDTDRVEGSYAVKDTVATPSAGTNYITYFNPAGSWNISAKKHLIFWLKCDRGNTAFTSTRVYIHDTAGNWRYWNLTFSAGVWTKHKKLLTAYDGQSAAAPDLAAIDHVSWRFVAADTVAFYKLFDAVFVDDRPEWIDGKYGRALGFDGVDDYVEVASNPTLRPDYITLMCWVRGTTLSDCRVLALMNDPAPPFTATIYISPGGLARWEFDGTAAPAKTQAGTKVVNDGHWHHLAIVYNGTTGFLYVDGVLDVSDVYAGGVLEWGTNPKVYVGKGTDGLLANGVIDEVRIFNRALSASEIKSLYELSAISYPSRGIDRSKRRDKVIIRGVDVDGNEIEGSAGTGVNVAVFTEKKASTEDTLDALARRRLADLNKESSGVKLPVKITDAYNLHPGYFVNLNKPSLALDGPYRIWRTVKKIELCETEIDRQEALTERYLERTKQYEELGIYVLQPITIDYEIFKRNGKFAVRIRSGVIAKESASAQEVIQWAVDNAVGGAAILLHGQTTYPDLSLTVTDKRIYFVGEGETTVLKPSANAIAIKFTTATANFDRPGGVRDLQINGIGISGTKGILLDKVSYTEIDRVYAYTESDAFTVLKGYNNKFRHCYGRAVSGRAFRVHPPAGEISADTVFIECSGKDSQYGFDMNEGANGFQIINCMATGNSIAGFYLAGNRSGGWLNNAIADLNSGDGIVVVDTANKYSEELQFTNCWSRSNRYGLLIKGSNSALGVKGLQAENIIIADNRLAGVRVEGYVEFVKIAGKIRDNDMDNVATDDATNILVINGPQFVTFRGFTGWTIVTPPSLRKNPVRIVMTADAPRFTIAYLRDTELFDKGASANARVGLINTHATHELQVWYSNIMGVDVPLNDVFKVESGSTGTIHVRDVSYLPRSGVFPSAPAKGERFYHTAYQQVFMYDPDAGMPNVGGWVPLTRIVHRGTTSERLAASKAPFDFWFDTDQKAMYMWDGAGWVYMGTSLALREGTEVRENFLLNSCFERDWDDDGIPDYWSQHIAAGSGAIIKDSTDSRAGKFSCKVTGETTTSQVCALSDYQLINAHVTHYLSVMAKPQYSDTGLLVVFYVYNKDKAYIGVKDSGVLTFSAGAWGKISFSCKPATDITGGGDARYFRVGLYVFNPATAPAFALFDDVIVSEMRAAAPTTQAVGYVSSVSGELITIGSAWTTLRTVTPNVDTDWYMFYSTMTADDTLLSGYFWYRVKATKGAVVKYFPKDDSLSDNIPIPSWVRTTPPVIITIPMNVNGWTLELQCKAQIGTPSVLHSTTSWGHSPHMHR